MIANTASLPSNQSLASNIPDGPVAQKWDRHLADIRLVSPKNKRNYHIVIVGTGLAGASAAATLAELGYRVTCFCFHDSPRRAHSVAAQGASTRPKTIRMMATVSGGCFTTPSRVATSARGRRTSIGWHNSVPASSINASPKAFRSLVNTAAIWRTDRSAAPKFPEPSTAAGRLGSNCCSAHMGR